MQKKLSATYTASINRIATGDPRAPLLLALIAATERTIYECEKRAKVPQDIYAIAQKIFGTFWPQRNRTVSVDENVPPLEACLTTIEQNPIASPYEIVQNYLSSAAGKVADEKTIAQLSRRCLEQAVRQHVTLLAKRNKAGELDHLVRWNHVMERVEQTIGNDYAI